MEAPTSRREFLRAAACGGAGLVILGNSRSARGAPANEKLGIALVGLGGRGNWFVQTIPKMERVVALCDVNDQKATVAHRKFPKLPKFHDFRKMLDKMGKQIDAVIVATPDNTHAVISAAAMKAGKHVYCEKPLALTVGESRVLRDTARRTKAVTSMGNQGTATPGFRRSLELIRDGALGTVQEVHAWNNGGGPGWTEAPKDEKKIPFYLKWDLWLGPAAFRPFHPKWMNWHGWRHFGTGQLGNWASHTQNLAFMALKVHELWDADPATKPRLRVEAKKQAINRLSFPRWEYIQWHIPARAGLPPVTFHWHNGGRRPGIKDELKKLLGRDLHWGPKDWSDWAGCLIIGTEGKIYTNAHNTTLKMLPEEKFKGVNKKGPEKVARSRGHERDWLIACRGGKPAWASFDYADPLNEFNMLGNVATQFEGPLEFDPLACKIVNNAEADQALRRDYRSGWSL